MATGGGTDEANVPLWDYLVVEQGGGGGKAVVSAIDGRLVAGRDLDFYAYLADLGHSGWELVAVAGDAYFFKRPYVGRCRRADASRTAGAGGDPGQ